MLHQRSVPSRPAGDRRLRFGLLGPLTLHTGGGPATPLLRPQARRLLALLLLDANHAVPRDRIESAFWGDRPPATARTALNNQVVHLRQVLGADGSARLTTSPAGYLLQVLPGELDADEFTEFLRAARAARGRGD
ncbi:MAG: hypothetical protein HOV87_30540, partial [Catenulispora sp.]|nr:hypothetical protein [Catenulispora sp.]